MAYGLENDLLGDLEKLMMTEIARSKLLSLHEAGDVLVLSERDFPETASVELSRLSLEGLGKLHGFQKPISPSQSPRLVTSTVCSRGGERQARKFACDSSSGMERIRSWTKTTWYW